MEIELSDETKLTLGDFSELIKATYENVGIKRRRDKFFLVVEGERCSKKF